MPKKSRMRKNLFETMKKTKIKKDDLREAYALGVISKSE